MEEKSRGTREKVSGQKAFGGWEHRPHVTLQTVVAPPRIAHYHTPGRLWSPWTITFKAVSLPGEPHLELPEGHILVEI